MTVYVAHNGRRIHYGAYIHTIIAFVYPPHTEQYAQSVLDKMKAKQQFIFKSLYMIHIISAVKILSAMLMEYYTEFV